MSGSTRARWVDPTNGAYVTDPSGIGYVLSNTGTHTFTVPAISSDNVVTGYGSYTKIGTAQVKLTMCAKQTGTAFSVGTEALHLLAAGSPEHRAQIVLAQ